MINVGEAAPRHRRRGVITAGLLVMFAGVAVAFLAIGYGGSVSPVAGGMVQVGFVLLVVGLCRRALAILESR